MAEKFDFTFDDDVLQAAIGAIDHRMDRAITAAMLYHAPQVEAYAKSNAPWKDRTSNARNGLFAVAERDAPNYRIVVGHGVSYGIWLEVRFSGRYATILPTINHEGPEVMQTISQLFSAIGR